MSEGREDRCADCAFGDRTKRIEVPVVEGPECAVWMSAPWGPVRGHIPSS